ncbi:hypothetical protein GYMLUDRAFT_42295 [Collybiopsis luxurians FD-317 M1]|uniref:BTB domain-containing protein n=1 Tax=Collybiopsis luxurians FD-317 M1 TaxID=944289 RepID=A0A0D0C145_9AGAR|nr:hypothetical protein GYMLUDRAFT_42295 [Collybiopsis luxurians FD-317 M1]
MEWDSILQFPDFQDNDSPFMYGNDAPIMQMPTPPTEKSQNSDIASDSVELVLISTTFSAHAKWHALPPDLVFATSDSVLFYVHSHIVLAASDNQFHSLIPTPYVDQSSNSVIYVLESSEAFNIILHLVYNIPSSQYSPSFDTVSEAIDRLSFYGINAKAYIAAKTHLHNLVLSFAPTLPIQVYTLAAKHDLLDLAIPASPHLLSFNLAAINQEMAEVMGPIYLRKLFFLHIGRSDALKRHLLELPHPHAPTAECSFNDQKSLTRAWALASAYFAWDARPDISIGALESCLKPLADHLTCDECKGSLQAHIKNLVINWSQVKIDP